MSIVLAFLAGGVVFAMGLVSGASLVLASQDRLKRAEEE